MPPRPGRAPHDARALAARPGPSAREPGPGASSSFAVGAAGFALASALLCPVPAGKDGGEFALVLARLGLAHPIGYPLYTLVGHAFVLAFHALGVSWAVAANAFSAAGAGAALGLLHAACTSLVRSHAGSRHAAWIALLPVAALALDPAWTAVATLAEVHAWHMACVALAVLVALGIEPMLASSARLAGASLLWGGAAGLGLAHHATSVFFVVPLTLGLLAAAGRAHARLRSAGFAAVGALPPLLALGGAGAVAALVENLNQRSKLPVFVFLPQLPSIRMLSRPAADSSGSGSP
jgi:hypothetical protein